MSPLVLVLVIAAGVAATVGLLKLVHTLMPPGELIEEPDRFHPHYGLIATAFAVLLAFVVLGSFQSYNLAKGGAEAEAVATVQLFRTADYLPAAEQADYQGEVICLARASIAEWPYMNDGETNPDVNEWLEREQRTISGIDPAEGGQGPAFSHLLSVQDERAAGRRERLSEETPAVTTPIWLTLIFGGLAVVLLPMLFTDRRERFAVQAAMCAGVAVMVVSGMSLVWFLDHPYEDRSGSIKPTEMTRSLAIMQEAEPGLAPPCDEDGTPA